MYTSIEATAKAWQVFREGIAPQLTADQLKTLLYGLRSGDPKLVRGATTLPGILGGLLRESSCRGACAIGYIALRSEASPTIGAVHRFFDSVYDACDRKLGALACQHFTKWWDGAPETTARVELKLLLEQIIDEREAAERHC